MLAHLAVRQQAAVGEGAGPTAPRLSRGFRFNEPSWGLEEDWGVRAARVHTLSLGPLLPLKSGAGTRAWLWCPQPFYLGGEVWVGRHGGLGLFLPLLFIGVCTSCSCSRLCRDGGRCLLIIRPFPLFFLFDTRGEEGTDVMLLLFL